MSVADDIREFLGFAPTKSTIADQKIAQATVMAHEARSYVNEGLMSMLSIALEDRDWLPADGFDRQRNSSTLTFKATQSAARNARALITGNPVMYSAAQAKAALVMSKPVRIEGADKIIKNPGNREEVFGHSAMLELMRSKIADGNLFALCNPMSKEVEMIPFYEIRGAIYDPSNASKIWYFYRVWTEKVTDFETNVEKTVEHKRLYKNTAYRPYGPVPEVAAGIQVEQISEIKHGRANRLIGAAWGVSDVLAGIFYAGEHKELIEAADAIYRAQSQYAITYKTKTAKALQSVAAHMAMPKSIDPSTGEPAQYGQEIAFGADVEMQLLSKIGSGIDFKNFNPIAALASSVLGIPSKVVLGDEEAGKELPATTLRIMQNEQRWWDEFLQEILAFLGKPEATIFWPPIDPDATHRQIQSIVGFAKMRLNSPEEIRIFGREVFGTDWDDAVPDPQLWEQYIALDAKSTAPGSTEPNGTITPGQGQSGQIGKLADGDHELRDEGDQEHTRQ